MPNERRNRRVQHHFLDIIERNSASPQRSNPGSPRSRHHGIDRNAILLYRVESSQLEPRRAFTAAQVENHSLTNFDVITRVAAQEGYIQQTDVDRLIAFRNNPSDETWITGGKK